MSTNLRQLPTVHARQTDITDQQIDALRRVQNRHRAVSIPGLDKGITQLTEHCANQHAHGRVVFDDQHGFAVKRIRQLRNIGDGAGQFFAAKARQVQSHCGAFIDLAVDRDMAA
ncbi:hypothetical protein D3C81_1703180 [compost metagenome]